VNHEDARYNANLILNWIHNLPPSVSGVYTVTGADVNRYKTAAENVIALLDAKPVKAARMTLWWNTFNAAITGCLHRADSYNAVSRARELADETHGKLEEL
jgi:hypothetical protein